MSKEDIAPKPPVDSIPAGDVEFYPDMTPDQEKEFDRLVDSGTMNAQTARESILGVTVRELGRVDRSKAGEAGRIAVRALDETSEAQAKRPPKKNPSGSSNENYRPATSNHWRPKNQADRYSSEDGTKYKY
jgi:hypothetical protein